MQQQGFKAPEAPAPIPSPYQSHPAVAANIAAKRYQQQAGVRPQGRAGVSSPKGNTQAAKHHGQQVLNDLTQHLTPEARANIQKALGQ
jgi:hypothetical protein